jgi:hypothetical protein
LYYLAVELNKLYGLYEPPAITVQKGGVYAPKTGILGRLGFSSPEAALIRKDLRAFTRRRELLASYIFPIILIILAIFESLGITTTGVTTRSTSIEYVAWMFLLPASSMAMLLGESLIGEEGQVVWRIYASPISAKNLVRSKFFFAVMFSIIVLIASSVVGVILYQPTLRKTVVLMLEAFFLVLVLASVNLQVGFKGADFSATRRARMVRQEWSFIGLGVTLAAGAAVLAPVIFLYGLALLHGTSISSLSLAIGAAISAAVSIAISAFFYRINVDSAQELLRKAEV